jgi:hypothetical protein
MFYDIPMGVSVLCTAPVSAQGILPNTSGPFINERDSRHNLFVMLTDV